MLYAAEGTRGSAMGLILETASEKCHAARLLVARRRPEDEPLQLAHRASAQPQGGLEALLAELPGVEAAAQLVQRGPSLLLDLVRCRLDQYRVGGGRVRRRNGDNPLALLGIEPFRGDHDGLPRLEPLQGRLVEQL